MGLVTKPSLLSPFKTTSQIKQAKNWLMLITPVQSQVLLLQQVPQRLGTSLLLSSSRIGTTGNVSTSPPLLWLMSSLVVEDGSDGQGFFGPQLTSHVIGCAVKVYRSIERRRREPFEFFRWVVVGGVILLLMLGERREGCGGQFLAFLRGCKRVEPVAGNVRGREGVGKSG